MRLVTQSSLRAWKACWLAACAYAALATSPTPGHAQDPVENLRQALAPATPEQEKNPEFLANRKKTIETALAEMQTIAQLRRAYFLKEWTHHAKMDKLEEIQALERYRVTIGEQFKKEVRKAAVDTDPERQIAVALLIAELGDSELPQERKGKGKFARTFIDVVSDLAKAKDARARQAALHAAGKITPRPGDAVALITNALSTDALGPRRVAAFALTDLVKNAYYLRITDDDKDKKKPATSEELATINLVIPAAALGMRDADEQVRGYCLQAIHDSARALTDYLTTNPFGITIEVDGKEVLDKDLQAILVTIDASNAQTLKALYDSKLNVRLTALQALDQIIVARGKIAQALQNIAPEKAGDTAVVFKAFGVSDPIGAIVERDWRLIAGLLKEDEVKLRRGAIDFLEQLGRQVEPAEKYLALALRDSDRMVHWSAARAIRNVPAKKVSSESIAALAAMLGDTDPDVSTVAAATIEGLGPIAERAAAGLASAIAQGDVEIRVAAMRALVSIGGSAGQRAIPKVIEVLTHTDPRARRAAAETLGRFGPAASAAIPGLRQALRDDDAEVRLYATEALLSIVGPNKRL